MNSRANGIVWVVLTLLTLAAFGLGGRTGAGHGALWILPLAAGKGLLLAWRFMELHVAHRAWKLAFLLLLATLTGFLFAWSA